MDIHQRIRILPDRLKVNQKQFCQLIGIPESGFVNMTKGRKDSGMSNLIKILEIFPQVQAEWLLRGEGDIFSNHSTNEIQNNEFNEPLPHYKKLKEPPIIEKTELEEKRWELAMMEIEALRRRVELLEKENKRKK